MLPCLSPGAVLAGVFVSIQHSTAGYRPGREVASLLLDSAACVAHGAIRFSRGCDDAVAAFLPCHIVSLSLQTDNRAMEETSRRAFPDASLDPSRARRKGQKRRIRREGMQRERRWSVWTSGPIPYRETLPQMVGISRRRHPENKSTNFTTGPCMQEKNVDGRRSILPLIATRRHLEARPYDRFGAGSVPAFEGPLVRGRSTYHPSAAHRIINR